MTEESRSTGRFAAVSVVVIGLYFLAMYCLAASVSTLATSLGTLKHSKTSISVGAPINTAPVRPASPVRPMFVDVSPASGLKVAGIQLPSICDPGQVELPDDTRVIGVVINSEPRAYVVEAFVVTHVAAAEDLSVHIVNDVVGDEAIAITHCNLTHSTRVLGRAGVERDAAAPLDVCVGGFHRGMLLVVDNALYPHHSQELPLADVPYLTTTWHDWLLRHPDSQVYTGRPCGS